MNITVLGAGKLGLPLATVLARAHHSVVVHDPAMTKLVTFEPDVEDYFDLLQLEADGEEAVARSQMSFIVVPTPSLPSGAFETKFVESALETVLRGAQREHIAVIVSTLSPGSCDLLAETYQTASVKLVYNPTFIALGQVVSDLLYPDQILIGVEDRRVASTVAEVWESVTKGSYNIFVGSFTEVEIIKLAVNNYLALKVSYANSIGQLCEAYDISPGILDFVGTDHRIGKSYLKAGGPYAGPCIPRDGAAIQAAAEKKGLHLSLFYAVDEVNLKVIQNIYEEVIETRPKSVGILGMSYKAGVPVPTESLGSYLVEVLSKWPKIKLKVHDPSERLATHPLYEAVRCDVVVIATPCHEYANVPIKGRVIDPWRIR
jgi:UDPglucose 6-dehydrogenase